MDCPSRFKPLAPRAVMAGALPPDAKSVAAVIVAAGKGLRAGQPLPKQFAIWRGKPVLRHAVEALAEAGLKRFVIAIPEGADEIARDALDGIEGVAFLAGGPTRQKSVALALEALADDAPDIVLIHDAARPDCPPEVVQRLLTALEHNAGAIPVLPVIDSMVVEQNGLMAANAQREKLRRVQTPQAFRFADILAAHRNWESEADAGDDAQVLRASGHDVALVKGDERLRKLTFAEDFMQRTAAAPRVGTGFDVHRLSDGEELWLCGVKIEHTHGLAGHSDADVALHAVVDAILGAGALGDIGQHFPPSDPHWKGAASNQFVRHAVLLATEAGMAIGNVDVTIICETPKIGPYRDAMRRALAEMLGTGVDAVSVKATTTEGLGLTGRGEGIAAQAVATLIGISS